MQKSFESLCNEKYKHEAKLSKHVWNLEKKKNRQFSIWWAIVKQIPAGRNGKRNCTMCLEEKLMIMNGRLKNIFNRRSDVVIFRGSSYIRIQVLPGGSLFELIITNKVVINK